MNSKAIRKQLLAAVAMVLVAAVALGSSTYAWFVSNTQVTATTSKVQASVAGGNLLIKAGYEQKTAQEGGATAASVTTSDGIAIYPASYNGGTWYVVNGWTSTSDGNIAANKYRDAAPTATAISTIKGATRGEWQDGEGNTRNAYLCGTYTIYASNGKYDIYLDPTNPVTVTGAATNGGAYDTLRVGIFTNGQLKVVYAPTADNGVTGNDQDTAVGWRMVEDADSTTWASYDVITAASKGVNVNGKGATLTENKYVAKSNTDNTYSAPDDNGVALSSGVQASGVKVEIYIWMEGTDAQCRIGTADGNTDENVYTVTANFVGVPSAS